VTVVAPELPLALAAALSAEATDSETEAQRAEPDESQESEPEQVALLDEATPAADTAPEPAVRSTNGRSSSSSSNRNTTRSRLFSRFRR